MFFWLVWKQGHERISRRRRISESKLFSSYFLHKITTFPPPLHQIFQHFFSQKLLFYQFRHAFVYCFDADAIGRCTSATSSASQNLRRVRRALHFDHREISSLDRSEGHRKIVVVSSSMLR